MGDATLAPRLHCWLGSLMLAASTLVLVGCASSTYAQAPPPDAIAAVRLARARETRAFTEHTLQHLAGGPDCLQAVFVSYARSDREPTISDQ